MSPILNDLKPVYLEYLPAVPHVVGAPTLLKIACVMNVNTMNGMQVIFLIPSFRDRN